MNIIEASRSKFKENPFSQYSPNAALGVLVQPLVVMVESLVTNFQEYSLDKNERKRHASCQRYTDDVN